MAGSGAVFAQIGEATNPLAYRRQEPGNDAPTGAVYVLSAAPVKQLLEARNRSGLGQTGMQ
jgi:hypothetical protein